MAYKGGGGSISHLQQKAPAQWLGLASSITPAVAMSASRPTADIEQTSPDVERCQDRT
jgi:hypothetical protein